jgi:hypothetical protein
MGRAAAAAGQSRDYGIRIVASAMVVAREECDGA